VRPLISKLVNDMPISYVPRRAYQGGNWPRRNDSTVQMAEMGAVSTLFSVVSRLASDVSAAEWHMHKTVATTSAQRSKASCDICEEPGVVLVTSHAALDLWNKPNEFYTRQQFVESVEQHMDLTGEAWWVLTRAQVYRAAILEMWPVRPDKMAPVPDSENYISGYIYYSPDGDKIPLATDEVIQTKLPNPLDSYRGMGPVQSLLHDLDAVRFSAEWNRNFFINSATPGGIIEVEANLSDPEFDEMRSRWAVQHRGVANAHRVAILERGAKWVDRNYTMKDMQFAEMRDVSRDVIREAFGIHKAILGLSDDVNRANAEAADWQYAKYLLTSRLERWKQTLNSRLLPMYPNTNQGLSFTYCSPVAEDQAANDSTRTSKANAFKTYIDAGVDPVTASSICGLPTIETITIKPAPVVPSVPVNHLGVDADPKALKVLNAAGPQGDEALQDLEDLLQELKDKWDGISADQYEDLIQQVKQAIDKGDYAALSELEVDNKDASSALFLSMMVMAGYAADRMVKSASEQGHTISRIKPMDHDMRRVSDTWTALMGEQLAVSAGREALRVAGPSSTGAEVSEGVRVHLEGLSDAFVREQLSGALWAGENIGRYVTLNAASPKPDYYLADEVRDKNTCSPCRAIDGTKFYTLGDAVMAYPNGGYNACLGGIRCRGTYEPVWTEAAA
jgi:HK97 family phage portal protein